MITGVGEIILVVAAAVVAFFVLRPNVPVWAWFVIYVGATLYFFASLVAHGPEPQRLGALAIFSLAALHTWWRDLRGNRDGRPPGRDPPA